jgi:hypoxanthine phosphoribosyltransferase
MQMKAYWLLCVSLLAFQGPALAEETASYLEPLITKEAIAQRIVEVGATLDQEYAGKELVLISILKGSMCITADIIRELHCPLSVEFIRASSYGARGSSRGELTIKGFDDLDIEGRDILLVDDIYDSGITLTTVMNKIQAKNPNSLKTLVVLSKKTDRRKLDYKPDYVLFEIEDYFVVGYGLDYKEYFRELSGIYNLNLKNLPKDQYIRAQATAK